MIPEESVWVVNSSSICSRKCKNRFCASQYKMSLLLLPVLVAEEGSWVEGSPIWDRSGEKVSALVSDCAVCMVRKTSVLHHRVFVFSVVCYFQIYQLCLILKQFDYRWALGGVEVLWAGLLLARAWCWQCCEAVLRGLIHVSSSSGMCEIMAIAPKLFSFLPHCSLYASPYSLCYQCAEEKHEYYFFSPMKPGNWELILY